MQTILWNGELLINVLEGLADQTDSNMSPDQERCTFPLGRITKKAFEMIKKDLTEAPVLAMPNNEGHMVLVSDTSMVACGSALYQEQKGRYRLIAYFSKKLPLSAQR